MSAYSLQMLKLSVTAFAILLLAQFAGGQDNASAPQTGSGLPDVVIKTSAREVLLDVGVRDGHGKMVTNLKAEDFTVYEDGVRQPVRSFRPVNGSAALSEEQKQTAETPATVAPGAAQPALNPLRAVNVVCLILHDLSAGTGETGQNTQALAFESARHFVNNELRQNTFIGIFSLDSSGLRPLLPFSNNREQLLEAVFKANPKTVAIIMSGGPGSVKWASQNVPAILAAWYPGEEAGTALASVLFGEYNPAGRLPYTGYDSVDQIPPQDEYDITKGFTYLYFAGKAQFAFGHGLSYTAFRYSGLKLSARNTPADGKVTVTLDVQNTGARAGDEVVQLYVHEVQASVKRPSKELRGFQRISLKPKEKKAVSFTLPAADLAFYDEKTRKFVVKPGAFDLMVGSSSEDIRLKGTLEVK